ncbi:MAG: hypothetical protein V1703_02960 [Candidatus Altiarchaeota archaeon]
MILTKSRKKGVENSVFGSKLSSQIVKALCKRFPGEPLKVLGRFIKTEFEVRITLAKDDQEIQQLENARKEFSKITGMGFEDILDKKDLKALKEYTKKPGKERKTISKVYQSLRKMLIISI